jgi:GDP-mannose 6-dehydrogenase
VDCPRNKHRISILGLGYVGSVMAACLAHLGHDVIGVDTNPVKVDLLNEGRCLIVEPQLDSLLTTAFAAGRIRATTDPTEAVLHSDVSFVCVGTPSLRAGRLDVSSVQRVSDEVGTALASKNGWHTIAIRSTVLPGTIESVVIPSLERNSGKHAEVDFVVCANPEFIREGTAIEDFFYPSFTVMGARQSRWLAPLRDIYRSLPGAVFETSIPTAEMVKYACNAFHALKIDFANEIGSLARELGVDPLKVMEVFCADTKLNTSRAYLRPGFAFGGSCLPKDVAALAHCARQQELTTPLLQAILPSNQAHIDRAMEAILACGKRRIGVLGLTFKPGTDDLRESAMLQLVKRLIGDGHQVLIYDRNVSRSFIHGANRRFAETEIPHIFCLLRPSLDEVVRKSEVVVVGNNDSEYLRAAELAENGQKIIDLVGMSWPSHLPPATVGTFCDPAILEPEHAGPVNELRAE